MIALKIIFQNAAPQGVGGVKGGKWNKLPSQNWTTKAINMKNVYSCLVLWRIELLHYTTVYLDYWLGNCNFQLDVICQGYLYSIGNILC